MFSILGASVALVPTVSRAVPKPIPADPWQGFRPGNWQVRTDVENFIAANCDPYLGDDSDLTGPTERTQALWVQAQMLQQAARATARRSAGPGGTPAGAFGADYLDRREELIYGLIDPLDVEQLPVGSDCRQLALYGSERLRRLGMQLGAVETVEALAGCYGLDIGRPAATAQQAIQWTYLALLATRDPLFGRRRSVTGLDTFFDVYFQRDLARGLLVEEEAQELVDDLMIKLRLPQPTLSELYLPLAAGVDPEGRPLVTRTDFRFVNTCYNLGPAAEPHLLVLWSAALSGAFRRFCGEVTIDTSSLRYARALPLPQTGLAHTFSPDALGATRTEQVENLGLWLDGQPEGDHLGINVFGREALLSTLTRPNKFAHLTVQLAEGAVDLHSLSPLGRRQVLLQLLGSFER